MVGGAFADSAVTHCHACRSSLKTSLTRLSRRPKTQSLYPAGRVRILPCFPADRSAPEKRACVGVPRAYRRCSRNLRKLDGRFLSSNHGSSARTVAYVIRCLGLEPQSFTRLAYTHKISSPRGRTVRSCNAASSSQYSVSS